MSDTTEWITPLKVWIGNIFLTILSGVTQSFILACITVASGLVMIGYTINKWFILRKKSKLEIEIMERQLKK